jgi:flagellar biosynthesis protein FlhB
MTLRELKEEFKQSEGDPAIRGKMKKCGRFACAGA